MTLRSGRAGGGRGVPPWAWPPLTAPRPGCQPHGPPTSLSLPAPRRRAVHARPACAPMAGKALSLLPPLLLAAAGLAGLLLLCVPTRDIREPPALKYGIVLDAGSSHTAMFIYKWPADKENDTGIVGQHSSCDVRGGGISSYADNPSGAGQSLVECLNQALRDVPEERHASTPLYLGATAGMRLLNLTSPEASASVLAAVTQTLTQYPFDFRGARILSGQDEGVFGWVTANYLLENFIKYGWVGRWFRPRKGTLGAMDLGGASTQITFETASPAEDPASEVQLRLYGQRYRVYTHSFLCYGRDQVLRRLLASALQTHGSHPCWPQGYSTHVMLQEVFESPCTAAQRPRAFNGSTRVSLAGSSDPTLCRGLVSQLFNASSCRFSRCSFSGVFQPPVAGKFIAFSAFFYTMDFLRTVMGLPVATLQQLEVAVVTVCGPPAPSSEFRDSKGREAHRRRRGRGKAALISQGREPGRFPDAAACPGSLDCALKRRARCPPGAHVCGPCLQPFQEDRQGLCVPRMRQPLGEGLHQPRLEEEIDFLAQELARQEAGRPGLKAPSQLEGQQRPPEAAATLGLSERGQGLGLGLPSTRGAPAPTPRPSLGPAVSSGPVHMSPLEPRGGHGDGLTLVLILACCVAGAAALAVAALFWWRLQRDIRLTKKADYTAPQAPSSPAPPGISPGDQRLAHSAEMYHYQHQRQQMRCLERHKEPPKELDSASSDEENEDGDFTVYECPGLAPTGEMEVRNPLFDHASLSTPPLQ